MDKPERKRRGPIGFTRDHPVWFVVLLMSIVLGLGVATVFFSWRLARWIQMNL